MTLQEVKRALNDITYFAEFRQSGDDTSELLEDLLFSNVLRAIADGRCENPAVLANAALASLEIRVPRVLRPSGVTLKVDFSDDRTATRE